MLGVSVVMELPDSENGIIGWEEEREREIHGSIKCRDPWKIHAVGLCVKGVMY